MNITERDKKILMLLIPVVLIAAYWFLLFAPKREESAAIQEKLTQAETEQQTAESQASSVSGAKSSFASDYTTVIRLGKAVPSTVDMPSLMMQLDRAARGTGIDFDKISTGERAAGAGPDAVGGGGGGNGTANPRPQSGPGQAKEAAQNGADQAGNTGTLKTARSPRLAAAAPRPRATRAARAPPRRVARPRRPADRRALRASSRSR